MNKTDRIFVAGHRGLVGSALLRMLKLRGFDNVILRDRKDLDLTRQEQVEAFFVATRPQYVFLAAARVGGIAANDSRPADFIFENLAIQTNVIDSAYRNGVERLLFLGSSCVYPRECPQPMREEYLLTGPLETTNEAYAIAKIAGIEMCAAYNAQYGTDFIAVMPTNLYGINDNFDLNDSHVLPALIRKVHEAKTTNSPHVVIWGSGTPQREFLHVDDLADACLFLMGRGDAAHLTNIGSGEEVSIRDLAKLVCTVVGYNGGLVFDTSKPDGTPRKLLDCSRLRVLGWRHSTELRAGIETTYEWYCDRFDAA
ncbi:MAG: GDP-L-fucose synthase [Gammaproteobacteria bacterium]|nr:GDP-L-fucose synthase [Gammaproteobacteria bacterium]MDH3465897.1 GDP-L-fucose synthase [Gammaproteobacteria bacterium]